MKPGGFALSLQQTEQIQDLKISETSDISSNRRVILSRDCSRNSFQAPSRKQSRNVAKTVMPQKENIACENKIWFGMS